MKKSLKILIPIVLVAVIVVIGVAFVVNNNNTGDVLKINSASDLTKLVDDIYAKCQNVNASLATNEIDISDNDMVNAMTGLENGKDLEYLVVSEPMMSSRAYSLVVAKVKNGVSADNIAKNMSENINTSKWICVSAEQLYATSSSDIVFLVMTDKETATTVYSSFKTLVGSVGKEYEKAESEIELPPEIISE